MATSAGFRQQCPSCEAMVPVRDSSFIGKKIDCPKCKYRFVVEEPPVEDDDVDEAPARGGSRVTAKKTVNGKGTAVATRKGKMRRDEDEEEAPKKKKGGPSTTLILGIGLGVVAVVALVIVGILVLGGDDSPKSNPPGGGGGTQVPNNAGNQQPVEQPVAGYSGKDATNFLLNDSNLVLRLNLSSSLPSGVGKGAFESPGSFSPLAFEQRFGFRLSDIETALRAISVRNNWHFNIIRTLKD